MQQKSVALYKWPPHDQHSQQDFDCCGKQVFKHSRYFYFIERIRNSALTELTENKAALLYYRFIMSYMTPDQM